MPECRASIERTAKMEDRMEDQAIEIEINAIRMAAAGLSQLLANGALGDDEWERAARILMSCRKACMEVGLQGR